MKRIELLLAAALVACNSDPVQHVDDPQITLSPDSITVDVGASTSVNAALRNTSEPALFVSRDPNVAKVNASGMITGVGAGVTHVVGTLSNSALARDSVRVRVQVAKSPADVQAAADSAFVATVRAQLQAMTQADQFSGAVLVTRNGATVFEGAYGLADRERNIPNTLLTQFRVGSMNKMMTAVATLQLVQAGKVSLYDQLRTYLPNYPNENVTVKVSPYHLLTHTGGTGDIFGPEFMANRLQLRTIDDYLNQYGTRDLRFAPGSLWEYSNYGFMLLGAVIERVSGTSYYDHVAARVLTPSGMTATGFAPEDSLVPGRAVAYTRQLVPGALVSAAPTLPYRGTPAGGGYSTVKDFARFADAIRERRLLDSQHTALLFTGKVAINPTSKYAFGFFDRTIGGRRFVGHTGGAQGMSGDLEFEPDGGYVVVVLSNFETVAVQISSFILERLPAVQ